MQYFNLDLIIELFMISIEITRTLKELKTNLILVQDEISFIGLPPDQTLFQIEFEILEYRKGNAKRFVIKREGKTLPFD